MATAAALPRTGNRMTGALRFESRVRGPRAAAARRIAAGDAVLVRGADSVTLLIAAATSFRRFDDVGGDPAAAVATALDRAAAKAVDALRAEHLRDYRQLFDRVTLVPGSVDARDPAYRRPCGGVRVRRRCGARGPLFPVRPVPA